VNRLGERSSRQLLFHSPDGKKWSPYNVREIGFTPSGTLKVGVFAEATAPGTFKVTFDQFKLTRVGGKAR
jgi:hypothetical protein